VGRPASGQAGDEPADRPEFKADVQGAREELLGESALAYLVAVEAGARAAAVLGKACGTASAAAAAAARSRAAEGRSGAGAKAVLAALAAAEGEWPRELPLPKWARPQRCLGLRGVGSRDCPAALSAGLASTLMLVREAVARSERGTAHKVRSCVGGYVATDASGVAAAGLTATEP